MREYFYKDHGKMKPYHYCSECGKRYNDDEFKAGLIINVGSSTTPIKYCATPCYLLKFPQPSPPVLKTSKLKKDIIPEPYAKGMFLGVINE